MADVDVVFCEGWRAMYAMHLSKKSDRLHYTVHFNLSHYHHWGYIVGISGCMLCSVAEPTVIALTLQL